MEITKPIINKNVLRELEVDETSLVVHAEESIIKNKVFENLDLEEIMFTTVIAENLEVRSSKCKEILLVDSTLHKCDFSGSIFSQSDFKRVEVHKTRVQGTQFMNAQLKNVVIRNCKGSDCSFRFSKMENVSFIDCDLVAADFQGSDMECVLFHNCNLSEAHLFSAKLKNVDLTSSEIQNIKINKEAIEKVTVDASQALYLSSIFGLVIEG